jgi:hypothetical protein
MAVDSCALFDHNGDNGDDLGWNVLRKVADVGILILVNDEVVFDLMGVMTWMMLVLRLKVCLKKWVFYNIMHRLVKLISVFIIRYCCQY